MMGDSQESKVHVPMLRNDRGIALLIVLLVTALLIALIFEFAYATRISLNSAINFRDSQRAYFLARSGIYAFIRDSKDLKELIPQGEWGVVPMISDAATQVRIRWEDEKGKINVWMIRKPGPLVSNPVYDWMTQLFFIKKISQDILDIISNNQITFQLPTQIRLVMNDEDFAKIQSDITTLPGDADYKINLNTAPLDVLKAIGISSTDAERIVASQGQVEFSSSNVTNYIDTATYAKISGNLIYSSNIYRVYAYATVGGYTKQVEAVVQGNIISYWRAL